jgi:hypothetical protein
MKFQVLFFYICSNFFTNCVHNSVHSALFMSMIFTLIEIKFDIDINNDELLIIIWEHNKKEICHW